MIVNYSALPRAFTLAPQLGGHKRSDFGAPSASIAELFGLAALGRAERARARRIASYYSKSVADVPHRASGTNNVVHGWVRALVEQRIGPTLRELAPYVTS